jgi:hypothetical protein
LVVDPLLLYFSFLPSTTKQNPPKKIYEYKQNHQWKKFIGILEWYLPTKLIPLLTPSVFTIGISVGKYRQNPRWNKRNLKKPKSKMTCSFLSTFLPKELQLHSNRENRVVTCHLYQQNCQWIEKQKHYVDNSIDKS